MGIEPAMRCIAVTNSTITQLRFECLSFLRDWKQIYEPRMDLKTLALFGFIGARVRLPEDSNTPQLVRVLVNLSNNLN